MNDAPEGRMPDYPESPTPDTDSVNAAFAEWGGGGSEAPFWVWMQAAQR